MSESILQRVARSDPGAARECIDAYGGFVWSLARKYLSGREDIEDAVQDIFAELWRFASRFDPAKGSEPTFIALIARRRLIDRRRRAELQKLERDPSVVHQPGPAALPESDPQRHELAGSALAAMRSLPEQQQTILRLAVLQGQTHESIAKAINLPLGTVKTHARRSLIRLRELMELSRPSRTGVPVKGVDA